MRRALLVTLSLLAITAGLISLAAWEPWRSREREHEVEWIKAYVAWTDRVDTGLSEGDYGSRSATATRRTRREVGDPPARLVAASRIVLAGCGRLRDAIAADEPSERQLAEWYDVRDAVLADLTDQRTRAAAAGAVAEARGPGDCTRGSPAGGVLLVRHSLGGAE